ncbi:MAG: tetratricopeptide repeat protein, partial [Flavobacteriales bacterium]|nr:tetratricopeptide repeat protein [Flavobacteriales bacterium]
IALILFFIPFLLTAPARAQKLHYENSESASKMFSNGNYKRAKELYREQYKKDLTNEKNKYYLAVCMVYTYERDDAIKMLEALAKKTGTDKEVWYHLAKAYHLENRYDKAIDLYKKYLNEGNEPTLKTEAERNIQMCQNAKILVKNPLNITYEKIDNMLNSAGDDYLPFIIPDESEMFFSTRREGTTGRIYDLENYYPADIYVSGYKYGKWKKAHSIGSPNSYGNEQSVGISENGNYLVFYVNNPQSKNNLQIAERGKKSFKKAEKIDNKDINLSSSLQLSGTLTNDGNYLIFSSDRPGGQGGQDLYACKKLPNGKWGNPTNLGSNINTPYDECYPTIEDEGSMLYFASKGHNSIGGFDLFKARIDLNAMEFEKPVNVGYPLNTPDDNLSISFSGSGKYAYVSAYRNDTEGGLDIYRVNFMDTDPQFTTIKGFVLDADSNTYNTPLSIEVFTKTGGDLYGIYEVNSKKGSYLMILPPNKYVMNVEVPGQGTFKKELNVQGRNKYKPEIERNIRVIFSPPANASDQ